MKITAIIIDDLSYAIESLQMQLEKHPEITVVTTAKNFQEAIQSINRYRPDLLFLDIRLGKNLAFDLLKQCRDMFTYVIFTTAHSQYAIQSFEYNVLYYLMKPIRETELKKAIQKLLSVEAQKSDVIKKLMR